jgi:chitinase
MTTSTVYTTTVRTITKCPPWVECPHQSDYVTTETIPLYTTVCPVSTTKGSEGPKPTNPPPHSEGETLTTTYYTTHTITKCPPTVHNCPVGSVVTEAVTTTWCPGNGEPEPTGPAPSGPAPTGPAEKPSGPAPSGPAEKPSGPVEVPSGPAPSAPVEVPTGPAPSAPVEKPTGPAPSGPAEKPSAPVEVPSVPVVTLEPKPSSVIPAPSGSNPPTSTPPVSGGSKVGVGAMALLGAALVLL